MPKCIGTFHKIGICKNCYQILQACFWLSLGTLKWDSVISRLPNLSSSTSSYDFTITPVFRIFKLYITVLAVYSVDPSSFIYVKIPNLTSVVGLVSVFPYFFCGSLQCCFADDKCLPKGITKIKLAKAEKKSENHWALFFL